MRQGKPGQTMFQVWLSEDDRNYLKELARRTERTESDVVRILIRTTELDSVHTGLPSIDVTTWEKAG